MDQENLKRKNTAKNAIQGLPRSWAARKLAGPAGITALSHSRHRKPDGVTMAVHVSTDSVPVGKGAEFFADALMQSYYRHDLRFPEGPRPFSASITSSRLGPLEVSRVLAEPYRVSRTRRLLSGDSDEYVLIGVQRRGVAAAVSLGGRDAISVRPGDLTIFTSNSPYSVEYREHMESTTFLLPRRMVPVPDSDLHRLAVTTVRGDEGLGRLMSAFLIRLADTVDSYAPEVGEEVARNVPDLVATLVAERLGHDRGDADTAQRVLLLRIRFFINRNLADPQLSAESIGRAHHVSARYVQRLFQRQGTTVGRWILRRRLEECRRELERRGPRVPAVGEIAQRWGFTGQAHFSHAFRAAHGMSPREWRAATASVILGARGATGSHPGRGRAVLLDGGDRLDPRIC